MHAPYLGVNRVRVLLIEDNDFTRSTVAAALCAENYVVVASVSSAKEAMQAAAEHDVDCAVIDLNLGTGPSGIDVAHALRKRNPTVGIVVLTTYADPRLLASGQRPMPAGGVYAVKDDIHSTGQLREKIEIALGEIKQPLRPAPVKVPLSDTQIELLRMLATGLTNAEMAKRRVVSERAIEAALSRTMRKLDITPKDGENPRTLLIQAYYSLIGGTGAR
jgi:DNA-binding NarL/FixJ family response regulator